MFLFEHNRGACEEMGKRNELETSCCRRPLGAYINDLHQDIIDNTVQVDQHLDVDPYNLLIEIRNKLADLDKRIASLQRSMDSSELAFLKQKVKEMHDKSEKSEQD